MSKDLLSFTADDVPGLNTATPGQDNSGLFDSLLWQESRGQQTKADGTPVTSKKGAIGIAQVMPDTAPEAARLAGLEYDDIKYRNDADYNKALGRAYFNKQLEDFGGDAAKALAAYNAGPTALRRALGAAEKAGNPDAWLHYLPPETQAYVPAILKRRGSAPTQTASTTGATPTDDGSKGDAYYTPDSTRYVTYKDPGPGASTMDYFKEVAASAIDSVGYAGQAAGEIGAAVANKATGTENYEGFNPLQPVSDKVRATMTPGGQAARQQGFQGDVLDPSTWQLPSSPDGWVMAAANGFGSMAATLLPALGQAGKVASLTRALEAAKAAGDAAKVSELTAAVSAASLRTAATGAAADAAVTGGAAAQDVRQSAAQTVAGMTHDQLMTTVPVYAQAFAETGDEQQARQAVVNRAAQFAGAFSAAAGAAGGAFNARVLEDFIAHKGMSTMLGNSVGSRTGRAAIGGVVGHVAEGGQEVAEKVGQNAGENVGLGRDVTDNVTRDSLGDFAGGAMVGGGMGAVAGASTSHHAPAVPAGLETVAQKASEPDSPLSRAAMAGNTGPLADAARAATAQQQQNDAAEAAKPDPLTERSAQIAATIRQQGALQALRSKDSPVKVQKVLEDLALAQSPSARPDQREQALSRLEYALEWAGVNPAAQATPQVQQIVGKATDPTAAPAADVSRETPAVGGVAQRAAIDAATGSTFGSKPAAPAPQAAAYDNTEAAQQRATAAQQLQASNEEAAAKLPEAPDVDKVIQALKVEPALRTAEQTALVKQAAARYQPEDMQLLQQSATYAAGLSATQKLRVQQLRGVGNPALAIGRAEGANAAAETAAAAPAPEQNVPNSGAAVPNLGTPAPAGEGPAVFRKRRATLRQLVDMGMSKVERRGDEYFLTDGKKSFKLDGAADAQLARRELQDSIRAGAEQANTAPTEAQKQAGNYKKGRVEFDGLKLGIENPIGSERSGTSPDGTKWSVKMTAHYGDLTSTTGADGDGVDVYLAEHPRAGSPVWVFDQYNDDGKFDEHKAVLGVPTEAEATKIYDAHFSDGSGPRRRRAVTKMSVDEFKAWANSPAAKKPAAGDKSGKAGSVAAGGTAAGAGPEGADAARGVADAGAQRVGGEIGDGADNPAAGAAPSGGETGALDHGGERAYVTVKVKGKKRQVPVIDITKLGSAARDGNRTTISRENAELIKALASAFGKEVVFFQNPERDLGDGFVMPKINSAIFVNESTTIQPLAVFGHELMHLMERELPQVHAALRAIVNERVKDGGRKAFRDDYNGRSAAHTDDALNSDELEELTSDLGGNLMSDPSFWREVMDRVQQDHPQQAKTLVAQLAAKLYAIIDKLVTALRGIRQPGFNADHFVSDLKTIRGAMRDAVAQYVAAHNIKGMPGEVQRHQSSAARAAAQSDTKSSKERDNSADDHATATEGDSSGVLGRSVAAAADEVPEYGKPREGAVSVLARHYGKEARKELSSAAYGRGYKGGERERVMQADDKRLRDRVHFYVDQGHGVQPESGVGPYAHEVRLNNIYDPRTRLIDHSGGANAFESRVIDAGFDGYLNPEFTTKQGAAVLLGKHNVPVKPVGMEAQRAAAAPAPAAEPEKKFESKSIEKHPELADVDLEKIPGARLKYGYLTIPVDSKEDANAELERISSDVRFSTARDNTVNSPEFKRWFGDSKVVDDGGAPKMVFHGTTADFTSFDRAHAGKTTGAENTKLGFFFTDRSDVASVYARMGGSEGQNIIPAFLSIEHPLRLTAQNMMEADKLLLQQLRDENDGAIIRVKTAMGEGGYQTVYMVRQSAQVKSAVGNNGNFDAAVDDITQSKARGDKIKPEVAEAAGPALRFLTPSERAKLRVDTATKLADLFQKLPSANEMAAVAHAGKAKRGWYHESAQALLHVFGPDAPRFAALLAALSPQTSVEINLRNALATWKNWTRAGRPTDKSEIFQIMGRSVEGNKLTDSVLPAWVPNSVRALTAEDPESIVLSGPKVNSFMLNLRGVTEEVTNDAWMANYAAVDQRIFSGSLNVAGTDPGKGPGYLAMSARVRQAAKRLTDLTGEEWTPAEVQETVWSWAKTLYELQDKQMGARELLENEAVTDELIQSTPDFRTQLHEERNEETLREAGYGKEVDSLRGRGRDAGSGDQGSAAGAKAAPFAGDAEGKLLRKAASRLEELKLAREAAEARTRELNAADVPEEIRQSTPRGLEPGLEGLPRFIEIPGHGTIVAGRLEKADQVARKYMADAGLSYNPPQQYVKVDPARAKRIAQAYAEMKHDPQDPKVKAAYDALAKETIAQYRAVLDSGLKVDFIDVEKGDPYAASPRLVTEDVRKNNHMWVFSTRDGFGSDATFDPADNPLLAETEFEIGGKKALVNDLFRVVHDYFGHVKEGLGFRADGEENAWRSHWAMFTPAARKALTTETRGQNSWVNYGPNGEKNRTASAADTVFADQKTGLLPDWVVTDGARDPSPHRDAALVQARKDRSVLEALLSCLA